MIQKVFNNKMNKINKKVSQILDNHSNSNKSSNIKYSKFIYFFVNNKSSYFK